MTDLDVWGHIAPGDRVRVVCHDDESCNVPIGGEGVVQGADDGMLVVLLDCGDLASMWLHEIELVEDEPDGC